MIEQCPRDPNIKTLKDLNEIEKEVKRVLSLKYEYGRKNFSDT